MSDSNPEPLTPPDCDLRGYEWMPLFGNRLFSSDFDARASDAEFRAAMMLWWQAWNQVPAASLPDDDALLCKLAGLGRDLKTWKSLRAGNALHGFVKCSDGRLYHAMLAEEAIDRFAARLKSQKKREGDNARLAAWRANKALKQAQKQLFLTHETDNEMTHNNDETHFRTLNNESEMSKRGEERRREKKEDISPELALTPPDAAPAKPAVSTQALFDEWWNLYARKNGKVEARKRFEVALKKTSFDVIMAATRRLVAATPKQYRKDPERWLQQERWRDEPDGPDPDGSAKPKSSMVVY